MAKINRVNIAITGDSKGLAAATDSATRELRRLQSQADRTRDRLRAMRGTTQQTAEALGRFGLQSRGLGMASGALGLASMGPGGIALGAAGAATAGITMAMSALANAVQQIPAERRAAVDALKAVDRDQRRSLAEFGFTRELAAAAARRGAGPVSAAEGLGFQGGVARGMAGTSTSQSRVLQSLVNEVPGAIGVQLGTLLGGGGSKLAQERANAMIAGTTVQEQAQGAIDMLNFYANHRGIIDFVTGIGNTLNFWSD